MNISSILNYYGSQQYVSTANNVSGVSSAVQGAFTKAAARIDSKIASTNVQVSAYGQVKSSVAQLQDAAKNLSSGKATTLADVKKGVQSLVDAYNSARTATTAVTGTSTAASKAATALNDTVTATANSSNLQKLGVTVAKDGSLSLNTKALEAAYQSSASSVQTAATSVGKALASTASDVLASKGTLSTTIDSLNTKVQTLETQRTNQQNAANSALQQITKSIGGLNTALSGAQSYLNIFSL